LLVPEIERRLLEGRLLVGVDHAHRRIAELPNVEGVVEAVVGADLDAVLLAVIELDGDLQFRLVEPERLEIFLVRQILLLLQAGQRREERIHRGLVGFRLHWLHQLPALLALDEPRDRLPVLRNAQLLGVRLVEVEELLALLLRLRLLPLVLAGPEGHAADPARDEQNSQEANQGLPALLHGAITGSCASARPPGPRSADRREADRRRR